MLLMRWQLAYPGEPIPWVGQFLGESRAPGGIMLPAAHAFNFGIIVTLVGIFILYVKVNILTAFLSLLASFLYIMGYTPMKRVSWLSTTIGAFPGAIPPLGGWAAATGHLNFSAGIALWWAGRRLTLTRSLADARNLLKATVLYLPVLFALIMLDVTF